MCKLLTSQRGNGWVKFQSFKFKNLLLFILNRKFRHRERVKVFFKVSQFYAKTHCRLFWSVFEQYLPSHPVGVSTVPLRSTWQSHRSLWRAKAPWDSTFKDYLKCGTPLEYFETPLHFIVPPPPPRGYKIRKISRITANFPLFFPISPQRSLW